MLRTSSRRWDKGRKTAVHGALAEVSQAARGAVGGSDTILASPPVASALVLRAIALMLATSFAAGAALATQDSLPDSPLHDVKLATEQVRLSLAQSSSLLVAVELDIAQARLREAVVLQAQDRQVEAEAAVSAYGEHVANAAAHFEESAAGAGSAALIQFRAQVIKQQQSIPAASAKRTAASETALGIAAEVAVSISQDNGAGAQEIAVAAAQAADKAATNIEKKVAPIVQIAPKSPVAPPANTPEAPRASAPVSTMVTPASATPGAPAPVVAAATTAAPVTTSSPMLAPTTPSSSTPAAQATSAVPAAETDQTRNDKIKTEAAAKTARDSADRAKQAADRAKQAAQKPGREGK